MNPEISLLNGEVSMVKRTGPKTEPCGTPNLKSLSSRQCVIEFYTLAAVAEAEVGGKPLKG